MSSPIVEITKLSDINNDSVPEVLITDIYSPREASYTEVFLFKDETLISTGGFWGYVFDGSTPVTVYCNSENESLFLTEINSSHSNYETNIFLAVNAENMSQNLLCITNANTEKINYFWANIVVNLDRNQINQITDSFSSYICDKNKYEDYYSKYSESLKKLYVVNSYDCGFLSIGNFPTSDMLAQKDFDYTEYI